MCNCLENKCDGNGLNKLDWNQYENSKSNYAKQIAMIQNNSYQNGGMNNGYSA
jgi:hypothetical protein